MINDRHHATKTRDGASLDKRSSSEAMLATVHRPEAKGKNGRTNWAWANTRLGYDWMDAHYHVTDCT
jgi:hypothetical protein